jgi:hypothetical protein
MATNNNNDVLPSNIATHEKFDDLISLVMRRSRGEVGNDDIEDAINSIIGAPSAAVSSARKVKNNNAIIPDEGNYDDDESDTADEPPQKKLAALEPEACLPPDKETKSSDSARNKKLEEIPFGKMGERMLVTFGDGTQPHLDVISEVLLGTRSCLQRAILDARALHRLHKEQWHQARAAAMMHSSSSVRDNMKKTGELTATAPSTGDSELSFRALGGIDPLRFDTPCGFGIEQLQKLFPEEMSAYQRWKNMHKAYIENAADDLKQSKDDNDDDDMNNNNKQDTEDDGGDDGTIDYGGRLTLRLANFDARTTEMGDDSYLKFADYRRGSFLSKNRGAPTADMKEWKEKQATKKRGRPSKRTNWQNLHISCVVFLHWVGFDQRSALSPPNEETTQALGFLAYDFFGKIVEKAVSLRLESTSSKGKARKLFGSEEPILELTGGDQLGVDDIKRSLAEVNLNSLYSSTDIDLGNSSKIAQLYFGPGFEDRLELELDEIFGPKKKKLSAQELERRKDEETLFSEISTPPTLLANINDVLLQNDDDELKEEEAGSS